MKADAHAQRTLLQVQELDSRATTLQYKRDTLPVLTEISELTGHRQTLQDQRRDLAIRVDDLTRDQEKADADVAQVRARRDRDQERLDSGAVSDPKAAERMQEEMQSLQRRVSTLEDQELEVMEQLEQAQAELAQVDQQIADADDRLQHLTVSRDEQLAELDTALAGLAAEREPLVAQVPEELLALYEKLRASKGGVGAATVHAGQCGGCRLVLDQAELSQIKQAGEDEVLRCEECQRILVRTEESGL